jgi:YD repeat-containing protein
MSRGFGLFLCSSIFLFVSHLTAQSGAVRYIYDELGRLVAVIDGAGASATYHYDAVGNLLSITRAIATDVTIIEFTPDGGSVGQTVTIYGTGFSATPANNSVSFNGTAASVTSSTANTIMTSVPSGATTGAISITSPNGSANSATNFVVGSTSAPSISGFSPTVGTAGGSVTVSGSNFETMLAHNRLALNLSRANLATAAASSLDMVVPSYAGSGRLTLVTPKGTAVSADDFFVPPSPYVANDVVATGRLTLSTSMNVVIGTAEKVGLVVFDGTAGQRISLKIVPPSSGTVSLYQPNLSQVSGHSTGIGTTLMEPPLLPVAGTYQFKLDPNFTSTGTYTITLYDVPADVNDTITFGTAKTFTTSVPGQNGSLTFSGTTDDRVSLVIGSGPSGSLAMRKPDGTTHESKTIGVATGFIDTTVLPATGTYSLFVDYLHANTGSVDLTLYSVPADISDTITADGSSKGVSIGTPGQNASLSFSGTANQRVSLNVSSGPSGSVALVRPDGSTQESVNSGTIAKFMEPQELATTGTYAIKVDPTNAATGSLTLNLYDVPADYAGSLVIGDPAVPLSLDPGQSGTFTFTGTATQQVTVRLTNNGIGLLNVKLLKPDGTQMVSSNTSASTFNLATQTLPTTGTYTIVINPSGNNEGTVNIRVTNP